jgi:hypothetical protein
MWERWDGIEWTSKVAGLLWFGGAFETTERGGEDSEMEMRGEKREG